MPGEDRLAKMREIAAKAQAEKETKTKEEAERAGREREAKGAERTQVEQELAGAVVELERLGAQLAEAEALVPQMEGVSIEDRAGFDAELAALRQEAEAARARLGDLNARKAVLAIELAPPTAAEAPAETPAEVPTEAAPEAAPEMSVVEQEKTRELTAEEAEKLRALQEKVAAFKEPSDAEKQQIQQLLGLEAKLGDLGDKKLLDLAINSFKGKLEEAGRTERPLMQNEEKLKHALKYGLVLETTTSEITKDMSPAESLLSEYAQYLERITQDKSVQEREPERVKLLQERIAEIQKLRTEIGNTRMKIVHAPEAGKQIIAAARGLKTEIASAQNTAARALEQKIRGKVKPGETADTQYLQKLHQLNLGFIKKVSF